MAGRECPESFDSGALTQRRIDGVWENHARLLGAYTFVSGALAKLGANVPVECPICFESALDYYLAQCGHFVCAGCRPRIQNCPLCRASGRVWRRGSALCQELAAAQTDEPPGTQRQTSAKFYELAKIIGGLGRSERVLVVSPLKSMLDDIHVEMRRLGHSLAILRGGAVEQQNTLRTWQAGGFKGLLSDPDLPGLSLSEASTVVFLSPQLTDVQFTQATGRVVRQGSFHKNVRVIVLGAAGTQETEDAEKIERFCQIACEHSSGTSSGACS